MKSAGLRESSPQKKFPGELRLVEFFDEETGKTYQFITNNFNLAASTIAGIYKRRSLLSGKKIRAVKG